MADTDIWSDLPPIVPEVLHDAPLPAPMTLPYVIQGDTFGTGYLNSQSVRHLVLGDRGSYHIEHGPTPALPSFRMVFTTNRCAFAGYIYASNTPRVGKTLWNVFLESLYTPVFANSINIYGTVRIFAGDQLGLFDITDSAVDCIVSSYRKMMR